MSADDKAEGRGWVMAGWDSIRAHYDEIRRYAAKDALITARLAEKMLPMIDNIPQAVNRGRYTMAYGRILQRGLVGEVQDSDAVVKHRGACLAQIQAPRVDLSQMGEQLGLDRISASDQGVQAGEKTVAGQTGERGFHRVTS